MPDVNSRLTEWEKLVSSGSADSFFNAYSDDEQLATIMNGFLLGTGTISAEQVRRARERFHELPRRGDVRDEKVASPTKHVILNKSQQLVVEEALAEILDNIFDNFERNPTPPNRLEVEIIVYPPTEASSGEIVVKENSGGIPSERIASLIQLGASDRSSGSIGAWGEGFKMAVFALGQEIEVFSHYLGEQPIAIFFPRGWLDPQNRMWTLWKVEIHDVLRNAPAEGTTIITISHLHQKVSQYFGVEVGADNQRTEEITTRLATYFGEVYTAPLVK